MKKITTIAAVGALLLTIDSVQAANTLLVDFFDNSNGGYFTSSASDFASVDSAVDLTASVNALNADNALAGVAITGIGFDAVFTKISGTGFSQGSGGPRNDVAILDGYLTDRFGNASGTISDLDEIAAGTAVTLTVWALGDTVSQEARLL